MKTQLLEDIGQSAALSPAPSQTAVGSQAGRAVPDRATAGAQPASALPETGERTSPLNLDNVFEEIAALEAQYMPPKAQHDPASAAVAPQPTPATHAAERLQKPASTLAEPTLDPLPGHGATAPRDPLFDFTAPLPAADAADPVIRVPSGRTRSRPRYLWWTACLLVLALLVQGGRWLYQERNQAGTLALAAEEVKEPRQGEGAAKSAATAARETTPAPAEVAHAASAVPSSRPAPGLPPLVMLEPESSAAGKSMQTAPQPEAAAQQETAAALPKPASREGRARPDAAVKPVKTKSEREPDRQRARASAAAADKPPAIDTSLAATLKACREHGYHATQCVKRGCSITEYGFACRGR